ncbi:MAG: hypothetical protein JW772_04690 [Candidatus Diapherotrites archaeon]|nr:hypothetical protein [Candidatus Diapherotrites archaeon]
MADVAQQLVDIIMNQIVAPGAGAIFWIIIAGVIVFFTWLIAKYVVKKLVIQILQNIGLDKWVEEQKVAQAIGNKKLSVIVGSLAKWYVIIIGLMAATGMKFSVNLAGQDIMVAPFGGLNEFLRILVLYIPKAIGGVLFFVLALLLAKFLANQVLTAQHKLKHAAAFILQAVIVLIALVVAVQMILGDEVGATVKELVTIFVGPFIWSLAIVIGIVGGLAVGLGFKEEIVKAMQDLKKEYLKK